MALLVQVVGRERGRIGRDQMESYAKRRGVVVEEVEKWLSANLAYDTVPAGVKCG